MKKLATAVGILLAMGVGSQAESFDDSGLYAGVGVARSDLNSNDFDETANEAAFKIGYMFTDSLGVDLTLTSAGVDSAVGLDVDAGIYMLSGVGSLPVGEYVDLYAKLGVARVAAEVSVLGVSQLDENTNQPFWGVGGEVDFGVANLFAEYNRIDTDDIDVNTAIAGVKVEF